MPSNHARPTLRRPWNVQPLLAIALTLLLIATANTVKATALHVINELRDGGCQRQQHLTPLQVNAQLQVAARQIANGLTPQNALDAAGYRATQLSSIHLRGYVRDAQIRKLLAAKYCDVLMKATWQQMGVEQRGDELWLVLAAPHAIPVDASTVARQVLALVNQARSNGRHCGGAAFAVAPPLQLNLILNQAAQLHAEDMAHHKQMTHAGSDGSTPAQRITRQGYRWSAVGENVAAGAGSADEVVSGWLQSPGHCANIMNPAFTEMGVSFAVNQHDEYVVYWAQSFARPR
jgi:uncharacterized protein YkwD